MLHRALSIVAAILILTSCASVGPSFAPRTPCVAGAFTVTDDFAGARRGQCVVVADDSVQVTILPEDEGYINDSPWYAFRVSPNTASTVTITLRYDGGHHRYRPKISHDGLHWATLDESNVSVSRRGRKATIRIATDGTPFWIAGQEIITPIFYDAWNQKIAATGLAALSVLGESRSKIPVFVLNANAAADNVLLLIGRQHPPEVTGAIAFFAFFEQLMGDTELAAKFRQRFNIIAVPLLNPDGVIGGNWRHNLGGTDLNRDWGPFEQPETRLVKNLLDQLDTSGKKIRVFLDFHSTKRNVFYTQNDDNPTVPPHFTRDWLEPARRRIKGYDFDNEENPVDAVGVSKNYMYKRYGIPSMTYEVGDETDREAIRHAATVFAEELMKLMLEQDYLRPFVPGAS